MNKLELAERWAEAEQRRAEAYDAYLEHAHGMKDGDDAYVNEMITKKQAWLDATNEATDAMQEWRKA